MCQREHDENKINSIEQLFYLNVHKKPTKEHKSNLKLCFWRFLNDFLIAIFLFYWYCDSLIAGVPNLFVYVKILYSSLLTIVQLYAQKIQMGSPFIQSQNTDKRYVSGLFTRKV